jgi:hypothetical protein
MKSFSKSTKDGFTLRRYQANEDGCVHLVVSSQFLQLIALFVDREKIFGKPKPALAISDIRSKMRKEIVYEKLSCHLLDMEMVLIRNR